MAQFVVPTIFTAVNQYSSQVVAMSRDTNKFSQQLTALDGKVNAVFSRLGGTVKNATKTLLAYGEAALIIEGTINSGRAIMDYQDEIANLSAVTGASGSKLELFKKEIEAVAEATKKSTVEVAQAFTNVDNNMPQFHDNAIALAEVTKQSIILAKASRDEVGPSAEFLTSSMNRFGLGADAAAASVDALASGAIVGSSRVKETTEALQMFGSTAANIAHITFAEAVALTELGSKFEKGSEEGTRLNGILTYMSTLKFSSAASEFRALGVDVNKVSNTSLPLIDRLKEVSKIMNGPKDKANKALFDVFGVRNEKMAAGLFANIEQADKIFAAVGKVGTAEKMAAINTNTLSGSVNQLGAAWITEITTSGKASSAVSVITGTVRFLTNHIDGLLTAVEIGVGLFASWKIGIWGFQKALFAYRFSIGIASALTKTFAVNCFSSEAGMYGMATGAFFLERGLMASLGIIGLVSAAIGVLVLNLDDDFDSMSNVTKGMDKFSNGFKQVREPINQATLAMQEYNKAVDKYSDFQTFKAHKEYMHDKGFFHGAAFDIYNAFKHPVFSSMNGGNADFTPKKEDYFNNLADTSQIQSEYIEGVTPGQAQTTFSPRDTEHNLNISINNNSGNEVSVQQNGAPMNIFYPSTINRNR